MSSSHFFHPQCTASLETGHNVLNTKRFDALATTQGIRAPDRLDFLTSGASQIFKRLRPLCLSTRRRPPGPRRRRATDRHHVSQAIATALLPMASTSDLTAVSQLSHRPAALRPAEPFTSPENRRRQEPDQGPGVAGGDHLGPPAGHQHPSQGRTPCWFRRPARAGSLPLGGYYTTEEITDAITAALGNYFTEVTANLVNAYTDTQLLNYDRGPVPVTLSNGVTASPGAADPPSTSSEEPTCCGTSGVLTATQKFGHDPHRVRQPREARITRSWKPERPSRRLRRAESVPALEAQALALIAGELVPY